MEDTLYNVRHNPREFGGTLRSSFCPDCEQTDKQKRTKIALGQHMAALEVYYLGKLNIIFVALWLSFIQTKYVYKYVLAGW